MQCIGAAVLILAILMALPALAAGLDDEKATALEEAKALLDSGEWKKAAKALKSYAKKHAKTDEEKKEIDLLILRAETEKDFADIDESFRKTSRVRPAIKGIRELLDGYMEEDELRDRLIEFREGVRSQFVGTVYDFEDEDWPSEDDTRVTAVDGLEWVKHGKRAIRWKTNRSGDTITLKSETKDWRPYTYFCFWIYSHEKPQRPGYIIFQPSEESWNHHFEYTFPVDFQGWKEVRIPFADKRGFGRYGNPDWGAIEDVRLWSPSDAGTTIDVTIDDIRLEKHVK